MLKLISNKETLTLKTHGAEFYYRRIRPLERQNIIRKNTKRGEVDWWTASIEMLQLCLKGWKGVGDDSGEVEFSPDLIESLPDEILSELIEAIGSAEVVEKK